MQGALAVPQIVDALGALDRDPDVDVIVLARGGGSVEDLLPFSDETLCRAVAGVPHAGGLGDRARAGHPAGRPRRRRALLHADRGGAAAGARPRRGDRADRGPARPGPPRAGRLGRPRAARARHPARPARRPPAGDRRARRAGRTGCRPTCAAPCCAGWTGARSTWSTPAPASPRSARPRRWPAATRSCSASPTTRCCRCCARSARWPRATGCASASADGVVAAYGGCRRARPRPARRRRP